IEIAKLLGRDGKFHAVPDKANYPFVNHALVYNKDIFNKFAVEYPKDHMTWDEVVELSKRLQRMDNGVQYYGLGLGTSQYMYEQLALQYTDRNNRVDVSNPLFHKIFEIYQE